jgi:hypothetical protein
LTSAISKDNGTTWKNFRTVAMSPGQTRVTRILTGDTVSFLKTPRPVPRESEMLGKEFHMNRAPRVQVIGESAYLVYTHRRYRYVAGALKRTVNQMRLRVFPVSWFHSAEPTK